MTSSKADPAERTWRVVAIAAILAALVVNVAVAASATHPSFPFDEVSPLQMSRLLAGQPVPPVGGGGYFPGWSVVLAPIWWIGVDPLVAYRIAVALGIALAMATIVPLSRIAVALGLSTAQAITVAATVMIMPSRSLQSDNVLSEQLLFFLVACTFWAAWRLWDAPSAARAVIFGVLLAAVQFTHVRMAPMTAAAGLWLVLLWLRDRRAAVIGLLTAVPLCALAYWGGVRLNLLLVGGFGQDERALGELALTRPSLVLRAGLGQTWEQVVGSLGLVLVGVVVLVGMVVRQLRARRVGPAGLVLGATTAMFLLSVLSWSRDSQLFSDGWRRLDVWIYGRYVEPLTAVVVTIGLALVVRGLRRRTAWLALGAALALFAPVLLWLAPQAPTWAYATPAHLAGVMPWWWALPTERFAEGAWIVPTLTNENRFWLIASVCTVAMLVLIIVLRRQALLLAVLFAVVFGAGSLVGNVRSDEFQRANGSPGPVVEAVTGIRASHPGLRIGYDRECQRSGFNTDSGLNYYAYYLLPTVLTATSSPGVQQPDVILGCADWPAGEAAGARRYRDVKSRDSVIWVLPGPVQDELAAQGRLS